MAKACSIGLLFLTLAGCGGMPQSTSRPTSSCSVPTAYECQVEMYMKAGR